MDVVTDALFYPERMSLDPLVHYYDNVWMIVGFSLSLGVIEVVGNFLLASVVHYEKYGIDPKKRSILNRLLSQICCVLIFGNLFCLSMFVYRHLFGPLCKKNGSETILNDMIFFLQLTL